MGKRLLQVHRISSAVLLSLYRCAWNIDISILLLIQLQEEKAASGRLYHTFCHQNCNVEFIVVDNWEKLVEIYTYQNTWRLRHGRVSLLRGDCSYSFTNKGTASFLATPYHQLC